ncbi:MAG: RNA polymerase-associated protein RapA, partial [Gammaproteobacteria bacterium]
VIAAHVETALAISQQMKLYDGIQASVFHEQMSIVERDRAAAFFAEKDDGCQVLVCSEIGSEGRNFQFAHHLVLFDLPLNPDLLEQRIGRLDRIGQSQTIQIHVPYFEQSAQQVLFNWYHEGLNAFEHTCPEGSTIYDQLEPQLLDALNQASTRHKAYLELLSQTQQRYKALHQSLQQGRDRLLEYNSCRPKQAQRLQLLALQDDAQSSIDEYMDYVYDCFGFDFEELSLNRYHIRPGEHMISSFPGLPDDGLTITYNRETALENEDIHFLSWEHPLIINAMDMVQTSELGNTSLTAVNYKGLKPGSLLLECLYLMESASSKRLQSNRYLPTTMIRVVIDEQGRDHHTALPHSNINEYQTLVDSNTSNKIIKAKQHEIRKLITTSEQLAYTNAPNIMAQAHARSQQALQSEINRLKALQSINPNVRDEEIHYFEQQLEQLGLVLENASLRLDAMRVIVTT